MDDAATGSDCPYGRGLRFMFRPRRVEHKSESDQKSAVEKAL